MQLMSIEDLAAYLGDSKRTIYKYIASGDCPAYMRISAKNIKFDRADIDAWLESKKVYPETGVKKMSDFTFVDNTKAAIRKITGKSKLHWTPRAKDVFEHAQKQARKDGFDIISTEHILFGIFSVEDCLGAKVLENIGLDSSKFHQHYERLSRSSNAGGAGKAKLSEDIIKVIRYAYEQATKWGHTYIGAEHLLIGILLAGTGQGFQMLTNLGITLENVREETAKLVVCRSVSTE